MKNKTAAFTVSFVFFLFVFGFLWSARGEEKKKSDMVLIQSLVFIPAGEFYMGSTEEEAKDAWETCKKIGSCPWDWFKGELPKHKVVLDAYFIDRYEVTNAQYKECVDVGKCKKPQDTTWYDNASYANHPVVNVDWEQANTFCKWAGKRLPTEAEWEKASRGENGNVYPWGNSWDENKCNNRDYIGTLTSSMAKMYMNRGTTPVGSFESGKSPYGAVDMAGNVWEWVSDWYDEKYYKNSPYKNPKGPKNGSYRVRRGGSWGDYYSGNFRGADRYWGYPDDAVNEWGFRCAKSSK